MLNVGQRQANYFPRDMSPHFGPRHSHNHAPQNPGVSLSHWDILPFPRASASPGVAEPDHRLRDPRRIDVACQGPVGYHPIPHVRNFQYFVSDLVNRLNMGNRIPLSNMCSPM